MSQIIKTGGAIVAAVLTLSLHGAIVAAGETVQATHGIAMHGAPKYGADARQLDYVSPAATVGGMLRLGRTGTFDNLNHYSLKGRAPAGRNLVVESLLARTRDEAFSLYGLIAESIKMPDDRTWIEFTLRPQARFHDGSPITVDDVLFTYMSLKDKGRPNHRLFYSRVKKVSLTGPRSIRFDFSPDNKDRELPLIMGFMPVLSKAYYSKFDFTKSTLQPPLGSGPYRVGKVTDGRSITYERVPDYWAKDLFFNKHRNNISSIRFEYFRDSNIMFEAFKAGELDFFEEHSSTRWARGYDFPAAKSGNVIKAEIPTGRPAGMRAFIFNTRKNKFSDPVVRQALGLAFDFAQVNKTLLFGDYQRTASYFAGSAFEAKGSLSAPEVKLLAGLQDVPPSALKPVHVSDAGGLRSRLLRARKQLEGAGWSIHEGQLRRDQDGLGLDFEILLVNASDEKLALAFARNLKRLGVKANVRVVDSAQYQLRRQNYEFDMIIDRWGLSHSPGNELHYYWGSAAADKPGTRNYPGIKNRAVDHLIDTAVSTSSRQTFTLALRALDRVLLAGHYVVPLYHRKGIRVAYWKKLQHPNPMPPIATFPDVWWLEAP